MTRDEIRNINDDYGFRGAIPYIYTNGHKYVTTNQIPS